MTARARVKGTNGNQGHNNVPMPKQPISRSPNKHSVTPCQRLAYFNRVIAHFSGRYNLSFLPLLPGGSAIEQARGLFPNCLAHASQQTGGQWVSSLLSTVPLAGAGAVPRCPTVRSTHAAAAPSGSSHAESEARAAGLQGAELPSSLRICSYLQPSRAQGLTEAGLRWGSLQRWLGFVPSGRVNASCTPHECLRRLFPGLPSII